MVIAGNSEYHNFQLDHSGVVVGGSIVSLFWVSDRISRGLICQFVVWSLVAGKMWGFSHDLGVVGRVSQVVVRYRSDSMGKRSVDEKVVVYARWSFATGVARTREHCINISSRKPLRPSESQ